MLDFKIDSNEIDRIGKFSKKEKNFKTCLLRIVKITKKKSTARICRQKNNYKYICNRGTKIRKKFSLEYRVKSFHDNFVILQFMLFGKFSYVGFTL